MELWKELLISGLQNKNTNFDITNDTILTSIIENKCYKILLQIKEILNDETLLDEDCFFKTRNILNTLEEYGVFCDRHDFG